MDAGPTLIIPRRFEDERGWFTVTWTAAGLAAHGITTAFVQDNQSLSRRAGTVRGLHFQGPPRAQAKLVRCVRGAIRDVVVDIRRNSPTYGRHLAVTLTAQGGEQMYVPFGLAHGFVTLEDDTEVAYKVSEAYAPACEGGLAWDDPALGIDWALGGVPPLMSERDRTWPRLEGLKTPFEDDGMPFRLSEIRL